MRYLETTKRPASRSLKWIETSSETTTIMTCEALLIYYNLLISIVGLKYCNSYQLWVLKNVRIKTHDSEDTNLILITILIFSYVV